MPGRRDLKKEAKLERYLRKKVDMPAVRLMARCLSDPSDPDHISLEGLTYKDLPAQLRIAKDLTLGVQAAQRAKKNEGATTNVFGMVMMQPRIESPTEWEAFAKQVHGESQQKTIEAVVVQDSTDRPDDE